MVYSIIPARGGSKGIPKKNIQLLGGYPLIAYSIAASRLTPQIKRTIVSTDSQEIAQVAKEYGAEVPFLRPAEISQDNSTDLEFLQHALKWFTENETVFPDLLVHLRPTTPLRIPSEISRAVKCLQSNPKATSLQSINELAEPPQKQFQLGKDGFLTGFFPEDPRPEYYNLPRQSFPKAYRANGVVDVLRSEFIRENNAQFGPFSLGFITMDTPEIDLPEDVEYLRYLLEKHGNPVYDYLSENFPPIIKGT